MRIKIKNKGPIPRPILIKESRESLQFYRCSDEKVAFNDWDCTHD